MRKSNKIFDFNLKGIVCENNKKDNCEITSPHFYKPQKKLFYIPQSNKIKRNMSKSKRRSKDHSLVKGSTNNYNRQYIMTEANSPLYQPEFERTTSPGLERQNLKFLSTKNTTEETEDLTSKQCTEFFNKPLKKSCLKEVNPMQTTKFSKNALSYLISHENSGRQDYDSNRICKNDSEETMKKISHEQSSKEEVPSMKDVRNENS